MTVFKGFRKKSHGTDSKLSPLAAVDARVRAERKAEQIAAKASKLSPKQKESGGPKGLEPTRYGDWEKAGRCIDF